jgi:hypothetical protein
MACSLFIGIVAIDARLHTVAQPKIREATSQRPWEPDNATLPTFCSLPGCTQPHGDKNGLKLSSTHFDDVPLGYVAVSTDWQKPTFRTSVLPPSSGLEDHKNCHRRGDLRSFFEKINVANEVRHYNSCSTTRKQTLFM